MTTDNAGHEKRKQDMLAKVRKLLAMANSETANATEAETAMRQANKIMAEYGIEEADCDMAAIDAGAMIFGEAQCTPSGATPTPGNVSRSVPTWAGVLAVGVGYFTDSIVARKANEFGEVLIFKGEKNDVLLARWIFGVLVASINLEQKRSGWTARGEANSFRSAAAGTLQRRMKELQKERRAMYQEAAAASNSRALVVVDRKNAEIVKRFGGQQTKSTRARVSSAGAYHAGQAAGQRINIPSGRPIGNTSQGKLT